MLRVAVASALRGAVGTLRATTRSIHAPRALSTVGLTGPAGTPPPPVETESPHNNIPAHVRALVHQTPKLHTIANHPLQILRSRVERFFTEHQAVPFDCLATMNPVVHVEQCFDDLLIPTDHVSRNPNDTYYVTKDYCLRPHTSAHQTSLLREGRRQFLCTGDVFRRDSIDRSHHVCFHQMEGVRVYSADELAAADALGPDGVTGKLATEYVEHELKTALEGLVQHIFAGVTDGTSIEGDAVRWVDAYFPFTHPSFEMEVQYMGEWLELLGCGVVQQAILDNSGVEGRGWAFGIGLERIAMALFNIPDIRLFWTQDRRFHEQFASGDIVQFQPYSKFPPCFKDVSFWEPTHRSFHEHELFEVVRHVGGDLVEEVECIDRFTNPKTARTSHCFRITYRHMDRSLTNEEVNDVQETLRNTLTSDLGVELR